MLCSHQYRTSFMFDAPDRELNLQLPSSPFLNPPFSTPPHPPGRKMRQKPWFGLFQSEWLYHITIHLTKSIRCQTHCELQDFLCSLFSGIGSVTGIYLCFSFLFMFELAVAITCTVCWCWHACVPWQFLSHSLISYGKSMGHLPLLHLNNPGGLMCLMEFILMETETYHLVGLWRRLSRTLQRFDI